MIIYLAGPLFTLAERRFNKQFAEALEHSYLPSQVLLPQNHAAEIAVTPDFAKRMYRFALDAIDYCDAVVAILDGADADSGTCVEIAYAKGKGKLVIGVRTDFRAGEDCGLNLMVSNVCTALVLTNCMTTTLEAVAEQVAEKLASHARSTAMPPRPCGENPGCGENAVEASPSATT